MKEEEEDIGNRHSEETNNVKGTRKKLLMKKTYINNMLRELRKDVVSINQ